MKADLHEWLHTQQEHRAREGSDLKQAARLYRDLSVGLLLLSAVLAISISALRALPLNADGSGQYRFAAPVFLSIAIVSALVLWKWRMRQRSIRFAAWGLLGFAVLFLPAGLLDLLAGQGR